MPTANSTTWMPFALANDGDRIISIDGEKLYLYQEISLYMQASYSGGDVEVWYR